MVSPITPEQAKLIKDSFTIIKEPKNQLLADHFYHDLFQTTPSYRKLFPSCMLQQKEKLMATLCLVVNGCHQFERLEPMLVQLGKMHAKLNLKTKDYEAVRQSLLRAIKPILGDNWTADIENAWEAAYLAMEKIMRQNSI